MNIMLLSPKDSQGEGLHVFFPSSYFTFWHLPALSRIFEVNMKIILDYYVRVTNKAINVYTKSRQVTSALNPHEIPTRTRIIFPTTKIYPHASFLLPPSFTSISTFYLAFVFHLFFFLSLSHPPPPFYSTSFNVPPPNGITWCPLGVRYLPISYIYTHYTHLLSN